MQSIASKFTIRIVRSFSQNREEIDLSMDKFKPTLKEAGISIFLISLDYKTMHVMTTTSKNRLLGFN